MRGSSLNPYATSFVPTSKRWISDENKEDLAGEVQSGNETFGDRPLQENALIEDQPQNIASQSYVQPTVAFQTKECSIWNDGHGGEFYASPSEYLSPSGVPGKSSLHDEFDMELDYLKMTFPDISEESLFDVYLANCCDLDAAIDMLNQLEIHPDDDDSLNKLPETLDIGDVSEPGPSTEPASLKLKSTTVVAETSTSGSLSSSSTR